jgi:predicted dehydrogenase
MITAAIVGLGRWGQRLVDSVSVPPSGKLRFVRGVARTPEKLPPSIAAGGLALVRDYAAVLADAEVQAVVLATPHTQHAEQVIAAARAGKHVFVEKPFTLDAASARAAAAACRQAGVVLAFGHNRRFLPALQEIARRVRSGALGEILHLEGNFSGNFGLGYKPDMWRATAAESPAGGMTAMGIHILDAFIHLAGPVDWVRCESHRQAVAVNMDDTTSLLLRFRSGATGYVGTMIATGRMVRVQVFGTRGWLHLLDHHLLETCDVNGRVERLEFPKVDIERAELEAFADAVEGTGAYPVTAEEAVHGVEVMEAAILSATRDGEKVSAQPE